MALRGAIVADLPLIARFERRYMDDVEPESVQGWLNAIDRNLAMWIDNLNRTVVAQVDDVAVGYAMWTPSGARAVLVSINVDPTRRRTGVGKGLLARTLGDARAAGATDMDLGVRPHNPARHLYQQAGFHQVADGSDGYERWTLSLAGGE